MIDMTFVRNWNIGMILLVCFASLFVSCGSTEQGTMPDQEVIVVVVAHPDDETAIGPVMAKYATDHEVYLIIATDGSYGVTEHAGIPEGDSLVQIRNREAACSCEALGAHPPIHLGLIDGLGFYARGNFYEQMSTLKDRLNTEITRLDPTIVLTFGPDGDTGHHDHRLVGNMVTEVLMSHSEFQDIDLYHYGWTKRQADKFPDWNLGYVDEAYLDTAISFSEADEQKAFASILCHKSQYPQNELDDWIKIEKEDEENTLYFRKAVRSQKRSSSF